MDWEQLEDLVQQLPPKFMVTLCGMKIMCSVEGWGQQVNGYYLTLETFSPEGYHVKFTMFDTKIVKLFNEYTP